VSRPGRLSGDEARLQHHRLAARALPEAGEGVRRVFQRKRAGAVTLPLADSAQGQLTVNRALTGLRLPALTMTTP